MYSIEVGQSAGCFLHKYENLDLEPSSHAERPGLAAHTCNPLTGDMKPVDPKSTLASWS